MDIDEKFKLQYSKFFIKIKEFETIDILEWNSNHLIGYYTSKYKEYYKRDYEFKYDKVPSQCFELKMIGRLKLAISSNPKIIKDYIDYYFENRVKKSKKRLSISSMIAEFLMTEFKSIYQIDTSKQEKISRSTQLPNSVLGILLKNKIQIRTYGDLIFLIESGQVNIKEQLKDIGFIYDEISPRVV